MPNERARKLRKNATDMERALWAILRTIKHQGLHFRRQAPFGKYIADFVCHSAKLVIELDGSQHADPHNARHDIVRTNFLKSQGYKVLRFWNSDVSDNSDGVAERILAEAK